MSDTNIIFKMGKGTLPTASSSTAGTIYFTEDKTYDNKNYGSLYYDNASGARVKINPTISNFEYYYNNGILSSRLSLEDNTKFEKEIPSASGTASGIITTGEQTIAGKKTFSGEVHAKTLYTTNTGSYL